VEEENLGYETQSKYFQIFISLHQPHSSLQFYNIPLIRCEIGESKKHPLVRQPGQKSRFEITTKEVQYLHNATPVNSGELALTANKYHEYRHVLNCIIHL